MKTTRSADDLTVCGIEWTTWPQGSAITRPEGVTDAEAAQHDRDLAVLDADPRTSGQANRPRWLTRRVLGK